MSWASVRCDPLPLDYRLEIYVADSTSHGHPPCHRSNAVDVSQLRRHDRRIQNLALPSFRCENGAASAAESLAINCAPPWRAGMTSPSSVSATAWPARSTCNRWSRCPLTFSGSARTTPAALAWLWTHWGTAQALHHVTSVSLAFPDDPAAPAPGEAQRGAELHSSDRDHHNTQSANQYLDERSVVSVVNEPSALGSRAAW
jgi:hypothetical protein